MSLKIDYIDRTGLSFYALVYKSDGTAYKTTTQIFSSYSDAAINFFNISLTEDANRAGYYTASIASSDVNGTNDILTIEIWQKLGSIADKTIDFIKGTTSIVWNGVNDIGTLEVPKLSDGYYLGTYGFSQPLYFYTYGISQYKKISLVDATGTFTVIGPSGTTITSGNLTQTDILLNPIYQGNFTTTTGVGNYTILAKSLINTYQCRSNFSFTIATGVNAIGGGGGTSNLNINQFGASTGLILDTIPSASSFITNLPNHINSHYCGQVLSFTSGSLIGAGRVITIYDGSTQRITLSKPFSNTPISGAPFIIWPLGGSVGLS